MPSAPLIPNDYVIRRSRNQVGGQRSLTVRKFSTTNVFDRENILTGMSNSRLVFGNEFGIIRTFDEDNPERNIRAMCGLVGDKNLVLLNQQTNELNYFRIKHALLATLMIEFMADPDSGLFEFLVYGGKQGRIELWNVLRREFGVVEDPIPRMFSSMAVRRLCESFFNLLYQIIIDPLNQSGWGTINAADFKSSRGQYIDPEVDRMRQVHENKDIIILSFKSEIRNQSMEPLEDFYNIRFSLLRDCGVNMQVPELKLPLTMSDLEYETVFYDFARQAYHRIIGDEDLYEPMPAETETGPEQLSLF